jgi:hypothetical protein
LDDLFAVLLGDYNSDGNVDAADYVAWQSTFGQSVANWSGADGNGNGTIDELDYGVWKANFGSTSGAGASANAVVAVPEPQHLTLAGIVLFSVFFRRRTHEACSTILGSMTEH